MKTTLALAALIVPACRLSAPYLKSGLINYFRNYHPSIVNYAIKLLLAAAVTQLTSMIFQDDAYNYAIIVLTWIGSMTGLSAATIFMLMQPKQ